MSTNSTTRPWSKASTTSWTLQMQKAPCPRSFPRNCPRSCPRKDRLGLWILLCSARYPRRVHLITAVQRSERNRNHRPNISSRNTQQWSRSFLRHCSKYRVRTTSCKKKPLIFFCRQDKIQKRASNVMKLALENEKLKAELKAMTDRLEAAKKAAERRANGLVEIPEPPESWNNYHVTPIVYPTISRWLYKYSTSRVP